METVAEWRSTVDGEEYPARYVLRILAALVIGAIGWTLWVMSLTVLKGEASLGLFGGSIGFCHFLFAICVIAGFTAPSVLWVLCILYLVSVVGAWWPVLSRPNFATCWFWRCASVGFIMPVYVLSLQHGQIAAPGTPSSGPACATWAVGSALMGVAVWLSPRRIRGEPSSGVEVLRRVWRGEPVLKSTPLGAGRAFPVVRHADEDV